GRHVPAHAVHLMHDIFRRVVVGPRLAHLARVASAQQLRPPDWIGERLHQPIDLAHGVEAESLAPLRIDFCIWGHWGALEHLGRTTPEIFYLLCADHALEDVEAVLPLG